jgi:TonB family protein
MKRIPLSIPLFFACAVASRAQMVYIVETPAGHMLPVAGAFGQLPKVLENGKLVPVYNSKQTLTKRAVSYADGEVTFPDFRIEEYFDNGVPVETNFSLFGTVISETSLKDCYLLLEFEPDPGNPPTIILVELPDLDAGVATPFKFTIPQDPTLHLQERDYKVHFFSGIHEHVSSKMPPADQVKARALTDSEILAQTENRSLRPLLKIRPERPEGIPADVAGSATIRCHVDVNGLVTDATVVKATTPAFGDSALEAVRQWLWVPAIKNHAYVEVTVDVPLNFKAAVPALAAPAAPPPSN